MPKSYPPLGPQPETGDPLFWQWCYRGEVRSCEVLAEHRARLKSGPLKSAMWDGVWALRCDARASVDMGKNCGVLLTMFADDPLSPDAASIW
jgi:hypothetical protein